uniref:ShKT domain-containing protein n=1 Tax=Rhabditophanes sp. KR3021 TaxID=114890 RepID=A0AC35TLS9_9BILA
MLKLTLVLFLSLFLVHSIADAQFLNCKSENCCDRNTFCVAWAGKGECETNSAYMHVNCQISCNQCSGLPTNRPPVTERDPTNVSGCDVVQPTEQVTQRRVFSFAQHQAAAQQNRCASENPKNLCSLNTCFHRQFRTIDGSCNNFERPAVGASFTSFVRLMRPVYEDGFAVEVGRRNRKRPNPRELSRLLISSRVKVLSNKNQMVMQFAQFFSHDITSNTITNACNCQSVHPNCINLFFDSFDPKRNRMQCMSITRSVQTCGTGVVGSPRQQMNRHSSYIDASNVYGSSPDVLQTVRTRQFLRTTVINNKHFPPLNLSPTFDSMVTGDDRSTLFVGLAAMHTIFVRLHNQIAEELQSMNTKWSTDRIFQETRKIVGGIMQVITYKEFIPALFGEQNVQGLIPTYKGYQEQVDASISNEFAAAAFRLHGMITTNYPLINERNQTIGNLRFIQGVNQMKEILGKGTHALLRGIISQPLKKPQRFEPQLTEEFFGGSVDMATINIVRGRDHGLGSYNDYRRVCNLTPLTNIMNWDVVSDNDVKQRVSQMYPNPEEIDLYVGGILEEPLPGALVGPTFACLLADQFKRSRDGDRFFYKNPETYTRNQMLALERVSFSSIICRTSDDFHRIALDAFTTDRGQNSIPCNRIPKLDLSAWRTHSA